jgi:hypothetical protein
MSFTGVGGEVAWYCPSLENSNPFDDLSGNGNNGTAIGGITTTAASGHGGSFAFDLSSSSRGVTLPSSIIAGLTEYSYSIYVNLNGGQGSSSNIFGGYKSSGSEANPTFFVSGGDFLRVLGKTDTGSTVSHTIANPATSGVWIHLSFTYSAANGLKTYVDGVLDDVYNSLPVTGAGVTPIAIGKSQYYGSTICLTDDARVFHHELSQADITLLASTRGYTAGGPPPADPYYNPFSSRVFDPANYERRIG